MNLIRVSEIRHSRIFVYGHGRGFQTLKTFILNRYMLKIAGIIDKQYQHPILNQDQQILANLEYFFNSSVFGDSDLIIVSIGCEETYTKIAESLKCRSAPKSIWAKQIFEYHLSHTAADHDHDLEFKRALKSGLVDSARALYTDRKSQLVFDEFIDFFSYPSGELSQIRSDPIKYQYFPKDLEIPRDISRFINAGAFDGDTLLSMRENRIGRSDEIICFEPDLGNFGKLTELVKSPIGLEISNQFYLFFSGLGSSISSSKFNGGALVNSSLDDFGNETIPIVTLDSVLPNFRPTFITMDIEGSEYHAIMGAEQMLRRSTPELAIAIYHSVDQFLSIPLLIKDFNLGYFFYLRNYTGFPAETILYATPMQQTC